jgi:hypothetical protein
MRNKQSTSFPEFTIIVGTGRSGTTYLTRMLRQAAKYGIPGEPKFVVSMYHRLHRFGDLQEEENLLRLVEAVHQTSAFQHLHNRRQIPSNAEEIFAKVTEPTYTGVLYATFAVLAEKWRGTRLGYKDPRDLVNMPLIAELLPTARFVHIVRDGRDYSLSVMKQIWGANNLYSGINDWRKYLKAAQRDIPTVADRYFELRYEDFLLDTESTCHRLGTFLRPQLSEAEIERLINRVNTTRITDNVYGWRRKLDTRQQCLCEAVAGDMLSTYTYERRFNDVAPVAFWTKLTYTGDDLVKRGINFLKRQQFQ